MILRSTFLIIFTFCVTSTFAQTKLIAHKSHSGKLSTFSIKTEGNFGLSAWPVPEKVIKLSDSTLVEVGHMEGMGVSHEYRDTILIKSHSCFSEGAHPGEKARYENVEFIGFTPDELRELKGKEDQ